MFRRAAALALAGVIGMGACDTMTEPTGEEAPAPRFSQGPVVQSVTGSGNFHFQGDFVRIFTDVAQLLADGSVRGQWERANPGVPGGGATKSHGVVTCFTIIGNQAWLGGYATSGNFSTPPDNEVGWRVVDNGQGANSPPDEISLQAVARPPGFAASWCANTPPLGTFPIQAGNIQVRP